MVPYWKILRAQKDKKVRTSHNSIVKIADCPICNYTKRIVKTIEAYINTVRKVDDIIVIVIVNG